MATSFPIPEEEAVEIVSLRKKKCEMTSGLLLLLRVWSGKRQ